MTLVSNFPNLPLRSQASNAIDIFCLIYLAQSFCHRPVGFLLGWNSSFFLWCEKCENHLNLQENWDVTDVTSKIHGYPCSLLQQVVARFFGDPCIPSFGKWSVKFGHEMPGCQEVRLTRKSQKAHSFHIKYPPETSCFFSRRFTHNYT